jgi:hypothetical protein
MYSMQTKIFSALFLICLGLFGCEKIDPADNASTIKVPYVLVASEQEGTIWKTNDAAIFDLWSGGGSAFSNEFFLADTNYVQIRQKLYVWNGIKSPSFPKIVSTFVPLTNVSPEKPGQMNIACQDKANKSIWVCANPTLYFTADNGASWKPYVSPPPLVSIGVPTSVSQTNDGQVYSLSVANKLFVNPGGLTTTAFIAATAIGIPTGTGADWAIAKNNNDLWMIDETGNTRPYISVNSGANFAGGTGLPLKKRVNMAKQIGASGDFYVGTDSAGLFKLNGTAFSKIGLGLPGNARIWDIVAKRNVFTTGSTKDYLFLATDSGLFMSENNGTDWKLVKEGAFVNVI